MFQNLMISVIDISIVRKRVIIHINIENNGKILTFFQWGRNDDFSYQYFSVAVVSMKLTR